ncbi:MAG: DUF1080 domain-containing protein [bacterium]
MNFHKIFFFALLILAVIPNEGMPSETDHNPYLGTWGLTLPNVGAGWLDVRQEEDYLDADLLWYGGSVLPVDTILMYDGQLCVVRYSDIIRKKDPEGKPIRKHILPLVLLLEIDGDTLTGKAMQPDDKGMKFETIEFTGKRLPPLPPAPDLPKIKYGEPVQLFNGKNLDGWIPIDKWGTKRKNAWYVENGVLVDNPVQEEGKPRVRYANLSTVKTFEDFSLHIEVNVPEHSNSGIFLRGIYEIQVYDSYQQPLDSHNMGAIYSRITPKVSAEKPAGQWQTLDITLCDRHVTVILNGITIIDNEPLRGCTGGALTPDETVPGPIYLQGDHGPVQYRNIVLKPIIK